jgi:hypothetical protein
MRQENTRSQLDLNSLFADDKITELRFEISERQNQLQDLSRSSYDYKRIKREIQEIEDDIDGHKLAKRIGYTRPVRGMAMA